MSDNERDEHPRASSSLSNAANSECSDDVNGESSNGTKGSNLEHTTNRSPLIGGSDAPLEDTSGLVTDIVSETIENEAVVNEISRNCNMEETPSQRTVNLPSESSSTEDVSGTIVESPTRASMRRQSSGTKSLFRSARSVNPGAIASTPSNGTNTSVARDDGDDESGRVSAELSRSSFTHRRESGTLPEIVGEEGENNEFESYFSDNDDVTTTIGPTRIVTAEVVDVGSVIMDQNERRRIVQEAIQTISDQAVTAEVVHQDSDKSVRKYRAFVVLLVFVVILVAAVIVLVVLFTTHKSDSSKNAPKNVAYTPTLSPTPFVDNSIFRTTEELLEAVDAYRMLAWNVTNHSSFETSEVSLRYGYPISTWNVSLITNFSYVFDPTRFAPDIPWEFNEELGDWDVSNAESMVGMFAYAYAFQGIGLEKWNVGKVKNFSYMFANSGFNETIAGWDTSSAEAMDYMFYQALLFNNDLSLWNVSRVRSMSGMFLSASSFEGIGLEYWNVHRVRDFSNMFSIAPLFNGTVSDWNTSSAENMEGVFGYASIYNDNLSYWDVSRVTTMAFMFIGASAFTGDGIAGWDVSKVTTMDRMFTDAVLFNGDVSQWKVSQLLSFSAMFYNASSFNRNLSTWHVAGISLMDRVFQDAVSFNGDVSTWDVSNVHDFSGMFSGCSAFTGDLSLWDTANSLYMSSMFNRATKFQGQGLANWSISNVFYLDYMFADAVSLTEDLSSWDVSNAQYMTYMFDGATSFNSDLSQWNVSNVLDASHMFSRAASFNHSLCSWQDILPSTVLLDRIFTDSACIDTSEPSLNGSSFCGVCT